MAIPQIDIILPGLFQLPLSELNKEFLTDELPALNHILRFGQRHPNRHEDFESIFADSLGLAGQSVLPFANAFVESGESSLQYLLCRAINIKPDIRNAFVVPIDQSEQTKNDISIIIKDLLELFKEDCDITVLGNGLWLMRLKHCEAPVHYPHVLSVIGRKIDPYVKQSRQALPWYQLNNEMQMFMHSHEVNQRRLLEGLLPINSLWCWGAGAFVEPTDGDIQCYCDDPVLAAYTDRAGLKLQSMADFPKAGFNRKNIYIDLELLEALKLSNGEDLQALLSEMESKLFNPLIKAVKTGQVNLRLRTGHDNDYHLSRLSSLKRWRPAYSLLTVANEVS